MQTSVAEIRPRGCWTVLGEGEGYAVMLVGGRGERCWPISTYAQPKAFLRLVGSESLLQATVRRVWLLRIREAWGVQEVLTREYSTFQKQSVDYGVLERMDEGVAMLSAEFAWDDPGGLGCVVSGAAYDGVLVCPKGRAQEVKRRREVPMTARRDWR